MRRLTIVASLIALVSAGIDAHVVLPAEFRTVVSDSVLIVRGRVTDVRSVAMPGGGIDSIAAVAIEAVLKGQADGFVYVRVPGGTVGHTRSIMIGAPTFRTGQRLELFLRPNATDATYRPIGLTMGIYPILPEPGGKRVVINPPVVAGRTAAATGAAVRGDRARTAMTIGEFESLVRLIIAAPGGQAIPRKGR
jgi:hypothetical protein